MNAWAGLMTRTKIYGDEEMTQTLQRNINKKMSLSITFPSIAGIWSSSICSVTTLSVKSGKLTGSENIATDLWKAKSRKFQ